MKATRLLFFSHHFPSKAAPGVALYNKQQLEHIAKYCDLKVCAAVGWIDWIRRGSAGRETDTELNAEYFPYFYTPKLFRRLYAFFMYISARSRFAELMKQKPDAIFVCWAFPDVVAISKLAKPYGIPFVAKVIGSDIYVYGQKPELRSQIVAALEQASAVVCVSEALKLALIDFGLPESKIYVVYNGVDDAKFYPASITEARKSLGIDINAEVILFIGNLKRSKGAVDIVKAFRRLVGSGGGENHTLILVGDDAERHLVEDEAKRTLNEFPDVDVRVVGQVPHEQLNNWINASDLVCLPSYSEGVPNVLLEAMSCGKPVVSTRVGGIPEIVDSRNGVLVDAGDIPALSDAIVEVLATEWDAGEIRESAVRFDWDTNAREIVRIVDSAVNRS